MPLDSDRPDAAQDSGDPQPDPLDSQSTEDSRADSADAPSGASADGAAEAAAAKTDADRPRRSWRDRARGAGYRVAALRRSKVAWAAAAVLLVLLISWERCGVRGCPSVARLASYLPGGASVLLDRTGEVFADLGPVDHRVVEIESLPAHVPAAFVAVEDRRFYSHDGVDWRRVVGAAFANIKAGRTVQGSSTITMQLSRNVFSDRIRASERTFRRKLLEVRVSRDIERHFTKDEILELYLNHIYFGGGAWGIEAAARHYFARAAEDLTLEQAALLAALPKAPSNYDPRRHEERARSRRNLVLSLMAEQGRITEAESETAQSGPIRVASSRSRRAEAPRATYFASVVRELLEDELGEDLYNSPLRIHTTLDMRAQVAAEEELEEQIRRVENGSYGRFDGPRLADWSAGDRQTDYLQGAVVVLDNATGDVLALVGGRDARHSVFNRATQAHRQVGSAFKPFVYATALGRGYSTAQWLDDSPYRLVGDNGKPWEPNNYDGEFFGPVTLRDALVMSRNVPTIRLASQVGERNVAKLARSAGINSELRESPMIALGIAEVSPIELTAAYTAFSGGGRAVEPRFVTLVVNAKGDTLWRPEVRAHQVLDPGIAWLMTDLMRDAVDRGTGRSVRTAGYRGLASGKSGTTNDGADAWFVGYTPRVTAGIWVGFDKPREIAPRASGGSVAGYAWGRMLRRIEGWAGGSPWEQSSRVVQVALDPETGLALAEGCEPRNGDPQTEFFLRGTAPDASCPERAGDSRSLFGRIGSFIGGLFGGDDDRDDRGESNGRRDDQRAEQRRQQPEYRVRPPTPAQERANRQAASERRSERQSERRSDEQWARDLLDGVEREIAVRRERQRDAIEVLQEITNRIEGHLDEDSRDAIEGLLDGALRSVEREARNRSRYEERRVEEWIEERIRDIRRSGPLDQQSRARIENEVRRALRSWM